jgi:hypothetical protein
MRVIYKDAEQGHAVPRTVMPVRNVFQPWNPEVVREDPPDMFPPGATAQNGMQEVALYECRACGATVTEHQLDSHRCEGEV